MPFISMTLAMSVMVHIDMITINNLFEIGYYSV